jgi:hypothetical protein
MQYSRNHLLNVILLNVILLSVILLNFTLLNVILEMSYCEFHSVECNSVECHFVKCHYVKCCKAFLYHIVIFAHIQKITKLLIQEKMVLNMTNIIHDIHQNDIEQSDTELKNNDSPQFTVVLPCYSTYNS